MCKGLVGAANGSAREVCRMDGATTEHSNTDSH